MHLVYVTGYQWFCSRKNAKNINKLNERLRCTKSVVVVCEQGQLRTSVIMLLSVFTFSQLRRDGAIALADATFEREKQPPKPFFEYRESKDPELSEKELRMMEEYRTFFADWDDGDFTEDGVTHLIPLNYRLFQIVSRWWPTPSTKGFQCTKMWVLSIFTLVYNPYL